MSDFDLLGSLNPASKPGAPATPAAPSGPETPQCSRKGCRTDAQWALLWNNPKIHPPQRRKTWLACPEHRAWLTDYLSARGFFREAVPVASLPAPTPPGAASAPSSPTED